MTPYRLRKKPRVTVNEKARKAFDNHMIPALCILSAETNISTKPLEPVEDQSQKADNMTNNKSNGKGSHNVLRFAQGANGVVQIATVISLNSPNEVLTGVG